MCSAPCSVLCAKFIILCSVQCVHSATSTLQVSQFATYLLIGLLRCYVQRPNGPHRAELYSSDILRTQTFFLEGVYFMVYMARHDVGAQAYRHQSRTVFQWHSSHIQTVCVGRGPIFSTSFTHPHSKNRTGTWLFIPGGLCTMTCKGMLRIARFSRSCSGFGKT